MSKRDLEALFNQEYKNLVRFLHARFGAGPPEPEDIAQHAFAQLHARGDMSDVKNQKAFLWRTARNLAVSGLRAESVRLSYRQTAASEKNDTAGVDLAPEHVLEAEQQLSILAATLERMPARRRRAIIMHRFDGLSYTEIGRRLGIGRTAATKHIVRAMQEISAAMEARAAETGGD